MRWTRFISVSHFTMLSFALCAVVSAQTPAGYYSASLQDGAEVAAVESHGPACGCDVGCDNGCDSGCDGYCACDCIGNWWDNTTIFLAGDGWKGVGEIPAGGYGNNFGLRTGFNTGLGIGESNLRAQIGGSVGFYDFRGRSLGDGDNTEVETQLFLTTGVFKRSDIACGDAWAYGVVWDLMNDNNYGVGGDDLTLSQFRGQLGYAVNECNEIGVWGAVRASDDDWSVSRGAPRTQLRTVNQGNVFWHHNWQFGADTTVYGGVADGLSQGTFGLLGNAPLSNSVALFGGFNYYAPSATAGQPGATEEFWNVTFGIAWYPGAKAVNHTVSGWKGMPLLDVANNGTFQATP